MTGTHSPAVIAIVDDDWRILESLESLFQSAGYTVLPFATARALLDGEQLTGVDCVIAAVGMPEVDGFKLRHEAKRRRPGLPVILMASRPEIADQGPAEDQGDGFFHKPFDAGALVKAVAKALEQADANRRGSPS